jgi:hypothetical protein
VGGLRLSGLKNAVANWSGVVAPQATAYIADRMGGFERVFELTSIVTLAGIAK